MKVTIPAYDLDYLTMSVPTYSTMEATFVFETKMSQHVHHSLRKQTCHFSKGLKNERREWLVEVSFV